MVQEQLLQEAIDAFERLIATAQDTARRGLTRQADTLGPREVVAHLAGWEVLAHARFSQIAVGKPPFEFHETPHIADAINAMIITMIGEQSLETLCGLLHQAYRQNIEVLRTLDERFFRSGEYVYERTKSVIEHCQEHIEGLLLGLASLYQRQGNSAEAEPLVKQALAISEHILGSDHPHTQAVQRTYDELRSV